MGLSDKRNNDIKPDDVKAVYEALLKKIDDQVAVLGNLKTAIGAKATELAKAVAEISNRQAQLDAFASAIQVLSLNDEKGLVKDASNAESKRTSVRKKVAEANNACTDLTKICQTVIDINKGIGSIQSSIASLKKPTTGELDSLENDYSKIAKNIIEYFKGKISSEFDSFSSAVVDFCTLKKNQNASYLQLMASINAKLTSYKSLYEGLKKSADHRDVLCYYGKKEIADKLNECVEKVEKTALSFAEKRKRITEAKAKYDLIAEGEGFISLNNEVKAGNVLSFKKIEEVKLSVDNPYGVTLLQQAANEEIRRINESKRKLTIISENTVELFKKLVETINAVLGEIESVLLGEDTTAVTDTKDLGEKAWNDIIADRTTQVSAYISNESVKQKKSKKTPKIDDDKFDVKNEELPPDAVIVALATETLNYLPCASTVTIAKLKEYKLISEKAKGVFIFKRGELTKPFERIECYSITRAAAVALQDRVQADKSIIVFNSITEE